jgi:YVTN family beta-propeller protein
MKLSARLLAAPLAAIALAAPLTGLTAAAASARPVTHSIAVGSNPYAVAISQRLGNAYVVNDGSISVISLTSHKELDEFGTGGFHGQDAIALVRNDSRGYVTNVDSKNLVVFDTGTDQVTGTITVGTGASDVVRAASPAGQVAYVGYTSGRHLTAISTRSGTVTATVRLPSGTQTLRTAPGGRLVWAGDSQSGRVFVVDTATNKVVRTIKVDRSGPVTSIAFAPGGKRAWVAGLGGVSVVSAATGKTVKFLPILRLFSSRSPNMGAVAFARSGRYALVENSTFPDSPQRGQVAAVDTRTYRVAWQVSTGAEPLDLAVDQVRNVAYTPNYADDTLTYFGVPK